MGCIEDLIGALMGVCLLALLEVLVAALLVCFAQNYGVLLLQCFKDYNCRVGWDWNSWYCGHCWYEE